MLPRIWWVWRATSPSISLPVAGSWATCPLRNSSPTPRTPSENGPTGAASLSVAIASRVMVNESFHLRRWLHRVTYGGGCIERDPDDVEALFEFVRRLVAE